MLFPAAEVVAEVADPSHISSVHFITSALSFTANFTSHLSGLAATTVSGTPALSRPIGVDHDQMPVGVQIHGPRFSDRWLVQAVKGFE